MLKQSGAATFAWCLRQGTAIADGFVGVKFKPIAGREDQAGGVVWRWKDGDNYCVARANPLEDNVSLHYTENGRRKTLKYVDAPVAAGTRHTLRAEFNARQIQVLHDGKRCIELEDDAIQGGGAPGIWAKADCVSAFDDFSYGAAKGA